MRATIVLTPEERQELKTKKRTEKNNKIFRRYLYIELSNKGMTNLEIAPLVGVCNDTLTDWKMIYAEAGLEGLSQLHYEGRRESKLNPYREQIQEKIAKDKVSTLKELQSYLHKECGIQVEQSWLFRFCKKNSILLIKKRG